MGWMPTKEEVFYNGEPSEEQSYFDAAKSAMTWLGDQENTVFIGQTTEYPGTFMYGTVENVPMEKRLEFPVAESFNVQFGIGAALAGLVPIVQIPRINFLLIAFGDIVNLLDKLPEMTNGQVNPHIIIRTAIGPDSPIHPKAQHVGDYTEAFVSSLDGCFQHNNIVDPGVVLYRPEKHNIVRAYQEMYNNPGMYLSIEDGRLY